MTNGGLSIGLRVLGTNGSKLTPQGLHRFYDTPHFFCHELIAGLVKMNSVGSQNTGISVRWIVF